MHVLTLDLGMRNRIRMKYKNDCKSLDPYSREPARCGFDKFIILIYLMIRLLIMFVSALI